jgi:outer membrane protein OmpA-like peptidoglycan-associated protein
VPRRAIAHKLALALASVAFATACGADRVQGGPRAVGEARTTSAPLSLLSCDLPDERERAPTFELDSARLSERGRDTLARIAACWRDGRLGRGKLVVIGFTDPHGPNEYNRQLGLYRAVAARELLVELGVPREALVTRSRGEREAKGEDARGWALDRRVEIRLAAE